MAANEIRMVDMGGTYPNLDKIRLSVEFDELASSIGLAKCVFFSSGCAVPHPRVDVGLFILPPTTFIQSTDILVNQERIGSDPPPLPGGDAVSERNDVVFNSCPTAAHGAYETLVHEGGHVLGIREVYEMARSDRSLEYYQDHPFEPGLIVGGPSHTNVISPSSRITVMSHNRYSGLRCSPHPFDILAIYAIYQSR